MKRYPCRNHRTWAVPSYLPGFLCIALRRKQSNKVLQFEHTVMNIGTLSEDDDPAMYHFKYHNVSKKPIYLSKLTTSCGCTVAKYDKKVVQPGEQGEIILVFHPMD